MVRILGMASGPGFNLLLANTKGSLFGLPLNNLNAVGLLLAAANLFAITVIWWLLDEPTVDHSSHHHGSKDGTSKDNKRAGVIKSLLCLEIIVPIISIYAFNANFQL